MLIVSCLCRVLGRLNSSLCNSASLCRLYMMKTQGLGLARNNCHSPRDERRPPAPHQNRQNDPESTLAPSPVCRPTVFSKDARQRTDSIVSYFAGEIFIRPMSNYPQTVNEVIDDTMTVVNSWTTCRKRVRRGTSLR